MAKFAKRHYEAIAETLQEVNPDRFVSTRIPERRVEFANTVRALADLFARDNGRFNRNRFIAACEPGANVRARTRYTMPHAIAAE